MPSAHVRAPRDTPSKPTGRTRVISSSATARTRLDRRFIACRGGPACASLGGGLTRGAKMRRRDASENHAQRACSPNSTEGRSPAVRDVQCRCQQRSVPAWVRNRGHTRGGEPDQWPSPVQASGARLQDKASSRDLQPGVARVARLAPLRRGDATTSTAQANSRCRTGAGNLNVSSSSAVHRESATAGKVGLTASPLSR